MRWSTNRKQLTDSKRARLCGGGQDIEYSKANAVAAYLAGGQCGVDENKISNTLASMK